MAELHPLWSGGGWSEGVRPVLRQRSLGLSTSEASLDVSLEPLTKLLDWHFVNIQLQLLLQLIEISLLSGAPAHVVSRAAVDGVSKLWAGLGSSFLSSEHFRVGFFLLEPSFFLVLHSVDAFRLQPL